MGLCFCFPTRNKSKRQSEQEEEYYNLNEEEEEIIQKEQVIKEEISNNHDKVVYFEKEKEKEKILFKFNEYLAEIQPSKFQELWKEFNKMKTKQYKLIKNIERDQVERKFKEYNIFLLAVGEISKNNFKYYFYSEFNLILFLGECIINENELILKVKSNLEEYMNIFFLNFENIFDI